ncbi:hypothetical protein Q0N40_02310 [Corynebacterium pseudokroppenstedtii]|uniref:Uncharacterized protein n=1 Tax=Corynebacterium pseudokroppenstedtii TaxID=2804917 RepID=A0AAU0Q1L6_9CORY|nr:hypothetical protein [Corynebacterium pseudokroppenstedtii]MDU6479574.1 hypothetical protein [Corynebacterium kroppenstedtii]MBY0791612.1 hypothetical protein [Corynebacterium pseudokroppenstedtii]MCF8703998.1 hypothetical protein [Corynebacterium pseudokroppenstedtii]MCG2637505.1 hypothetical protein [Corynebacterium pseudokroppenstedtii]MDU7503170.1 hypothetical protein [Corynebacterium kroppenstedtii]
MEYKYTDRDSYGEFSPSTLIDRLESAGVLPHELANVFTQASNAVLNVSDDARSNVEQALSTLANEAESGQKVKDTLRANLETALEEPDPLKKVADFKTAADELVDGLENQLKDLGLGDVSSLDDVRSSVRDFAEALDTLNASAPIAKIVENLPGGALPGHVLEALAGLRQDELDDIRKHVDAITDRGARVIADLASIGADEAVRHAARANKTLTPLLAIALAIGAVVGQGAEAVKAIADVGAALKAAIVKGFLTAGKGLLAAPVIAQVKSAKALPFAVVALQMFNHHEIRMALLNVFNDLIINTVTAFNTSVVVKAIRAAVDMLVLSTPIRIAVRGNNIMLILNALNIGRILFNIFLLTRIPQIGHLPIRGLGLRGVETLFAGAYTTWRLLKTILTPLAFKPGVLLGDAVALALVAYLVVGALTV